MYNELQEKFVEKVAFTDWDVFKLRHHPHELCDVVLKEIVRDRQVIVSEFCDICPLILGCKIDKHQTIVHRRIQAAEKRVEINRYKELLKRKGEHEKC